MELCSRPCWLSLYAPPYPYSSFNLGSRIKGPTEYILWYHTVEPPLQIWATALCWVLFEPYHVHVFEKSDSFHAKIRHCFKMHQNRWYSWASSKIQLHGSVYNVECSQRHLNSAGIEILAHLRKILGSAGKKIDFRFNYTPKCMVSSMKFQKFSGKELTEPPPQTPPLLNP